MSDDRFDLNVDLKDERKAEPVRRIEVITGPERRRTWSADDKLAIVAESLGEGVVISDVARRHGLRPQQLFAWRSQFKAQMEAERANQGYPPFVEAIADGSPAGDPVLQAATVRSTVSHRPSPSIEITVGRASVRVHGAADPRTIAAVLKSLRGLT